MIRLYKYRSLQRLDYVLDIILNERLHCSSYKNLNDPFEGLFATEIYFAPEAEFSALLNDSNVPRSIITYDDIDLLISSSNPLLKICSFSSDLSDVRLWSHYADSHKGIAIQIDLEDDVDVKKVTYNKRLPSYCRTLISSEPIISEILINKTMHWEYECEYRILTNQVYYPIKSCISGIYCGIRIDEEKLSILRRIIPMNIPIYTTRLQRSEIKVIPDKKYSF